MDRTILKSAYDELKTINDGIANGAYVGFKGYCDTEGWGGADVVFSTISINFGAPGFYPDPRLVVTPYAHEAGWLLTELNRVFMGLIDSCSKTEFFGRLAIGAVRYQESLTTSNESAAGLLGAILGEAHAMLTEMEAGRFEYLLVASGNTIAHDLRDDGGSCG